MHVYRRRGALALAATLAAVACSDTLSPAIIPGFYADLSGDQVVPAVAVSATGTYNFTTGADSGLTVTTGTLTGLSGAPTKIAIYVGAAGANGTERGDVCGGSAPACTAGSTSVTNTAVTMIGTFTKGQLYTALHTYGGGYIMVNTAAHATGEIRGVVVFNPLQ